MGALLFFVCLGLDCFLFLNFFFVLGKDGEMGKWWKQIVTAFTNAKWCFYRYFLSFYLCSLCNEGSHLEGKQLPMRRFTTVMTICLLLFIAMKIEWLFPKRSWIQIMVPLLR